MEPDPVTGFLQPSLNYSIAGFTADKKEKFLVYFENCGNISASMDAVGLDRGVFYDALKIDREFARRYKMALLGMKRSLEGTMYHNGLKPNGYMDRITWLRRHFPEEYNPKTVIQHSSEPKEMDGIFARLLERAERDGAVIRVEPEPDKPL
jgi:hypothetical protein